MFECWPEFLYVTLCEDNIYPIRMKRLYNRDRWRKSGEVNDLQWNDTGFLDKIILLNISYFVLINIYKDLEKYCFGINYMYIFNDLTR